MKHKYGEFTQKQFSEYKKQLHSKVHWLLLYKEQDYPKLDQYFSSLLFQISGLATLIDSPYVVTLMTLLEAARSENLSDECDYGKYRKAILDAHSIIDMIPEEDGD